MIFYLQMTDCLLTPKPVQTFEYSQEELQPYFLLYAQLGVYILPKHLISRPIVLFFHTTKNCFFAENWSMCIWFRVLQVAVNNN